METARPLISIMVGLVVVGFLKLKGHVMHGVQEALYDLAESSLAFAIENENVLTDMQRRKFTAFALDALRQAREMASDTSQPRARWLEKAKSIIDIGVKLFLKYGKSAAE